MPAQHPGNTAPPTMAPSHAHGVERGTTVRGTMGPPQDNDDEKDEGQAGQRTTPP